MKVTKSKVITLLLGFILLIGLSIIGLLNISTENMIASADTMDETYDDFIVTEYSENVKATYNFVKLNDNECSVRIANKSEATKAIIPSFAIIDGKTYSVTEVAANGFMASPKLVKVSLPATIKKIGNMAFANCPELQRVSLANVEEIGSSVFYRCPKLGKLVIPESTEKIGTYILRDNNTEVKVRAESDGANWANSWNLNNSNQEVEYNSKYVEPLELEPVYNTNTRAADSTIIGYVVSSGQPRTDNYYDFSPNVEDGSIYIPAEFNGLDILAIDSFAFADTFSEEIVIGYSFKPIMLSVGAFASSNCDVILINRPIEYRDYADDSETSDIFNSSTVQTIILPDSLNSIADSMFNSCENLKNIYFRSDRNVLNIINAQAETEEGIVHLPDAPNFDTIGQNAFEGTTSITELHIYGNVKNVGEYIVNGWSDTQTVFVHDYESLPEYDFDTQTGWNPYWKGSFTNVRFDSEHYTITLNSNGGRFADGDTNKEIDVIYGQAVGELPVPEKLHCKFIGWFDKNGLLYTEDTIFNLNSDLELIANWEDILFKVEFDKQGGIGGSDYVDATFGKSMPEAIQPSREGYWFKGYLTDKNGGGTKYYDFALDDSGEMRSVHTWDRDSNTTLYAHWVSIETKISYTLNGGTNNPNNVTVCNYFDYIELKDATRVGYVFNGWYLNGQKVTKITKCSEEEITLVAKWDTRINAAVYTIDITTQTITLSGASAFILKLPSSNQVMRIDIYSDVRQVHIFSETYREYGIYIIIHSRATYLDLHLENFIMTAPNMNYSSSGYQALAAITMETSNNSALNLYTYGTVKINGASGWDAPSGTAKDGNYAISCAVLNVKRADNLTLTGGDGGYGSINGRGAAAVHCNSMSLCDNVTLIDGKGRSLLT